MLLSKKFIIVLLAAAFSSGMLWGLNAGLAEERPCFEPVKTKVMRCSDKAQNLTVEINGAKDLYLVATYGGDSYDCDQAIWANPILVDKSGKETDLTTLKPKLAQTGWGGGIITNKAHDGVPLQIGKETFKKGFWAHGPSIIHFELDGSYDLFKVTVGIDARGVRGSVEFQVLSYPVQMPEKVKYARVASGPASEPILPAAESEHVFNKEAAEKLIENGVEEILFLRHYTFVSNHVYTDHVNNSWMPGGGFCFLNLKTGEVREILPELRSGMIHRFDISFDAKKIVFDFKKEPMEGYRIYEVNIDGTGLKQLTFPVENEKELVDRYHSGGYHRGTDDMQPCYLPDGGIAFVSTRCQFSVLCDSSDNFTVSNLYRMDGDGKNIQPLTYSALNEQSPAVMPDGRILYHRWEYVDKAAGNAKALWAVNPDGTGSVEVFGNNISYPETMIYPRPIPGTDSKIVFLGASHCCPNNALGTVIVIDTKDNVRDPESMNYITEDVRAYHHNGFHFKNDKGEWYQDKTGVPGRLFKDPYPINEELFIVSHKPQGVFWSEKAGYDLSLLDEEGNDTLLYKDEKVSCWLPYPVMEREVPLVRSSIINEQMATENRALCVITDVYTGMDDVERGAVKYIRIMEQVPRSWSSRKGWGGDHEGTTHAHSALGQGHLSLKIQLGVVPVEPDGSARFYVPADRAIYFQALDEKYRSIQTERTYVNYRPGETRSCLGCHELQKDTPLRPNVLVPQAMSKPPYETYLPQLNEKDAEFVFDYDRKIQPIWDKHCISCHGEAADGNKNATPDLRGTLESTYSVSYHQLVLLGNNSQKELLGNRAERNEDAAFNEIVYIPPYRTGALSSPLSAWLSGDLTIKKPTNADVQKYAEYLKEVHKDAAISLSDDELLLINNWLDVNVPYHRSYWGRMNAKYQGHPNFRPEVTPDEARSRTLPEKIRKNEEPVK